MVLGPSGVGKSSVAERLVGPSPLVLDGRQLRQALVRRVRTGKWPKALLESAALVIDGPEHFEDGDHPLAMLADLLGARTAGGFRTAVVEVPGDGSVEALLRCMPPGASVVIGLRFPKGQRGRVRFARRECQRLGLGQSAAAATARLEPWTYRRVTEFLERSVDKDAS